MLCRKHEGTKNYLKKKIGGPLIIGKNMETKIESAKRDVRTFPTFGSLLYVGLRDFFNSAAWFLSVKHSIMSDTLGTIPILRQHRFDFFSPTRT